MSNATVFLSNADTLFTALSDAEGTFVLENLPPGHYSLLVKHLGYKPYYEPEVLLEASKNPYRTSTYGLDLRLNRSFYRGWYTLLSGSLFDARYTGANGEEHHSPFNSRWVLSGTGGKDWTTQKANAQRTLGLHLRLLSRGGYWYTPIDISGSKAAQREVLLWEEPYSQQLPAYYSLDVRVSHTREKPGYTRIWALDIQNVTGRENLGWYYYDFFSEEVKAQYQLGLIPVMAYRIQF